MTNGIDIRNLTFCYGEKKILDDLSITLDTGQFIGIMGPNGCGKSTLLDLLVGNLKPLNGEIRLNGKNLTRFSRRQLSKEMALVPQNFYINFPFTAEEIVMMGRYPHMPRFSQPSAADRQKVEKVMRMTETDRFCGRFITELSGGERQRVVVARALVQDTPILVLDEATSNMDINHTLGLLNLAAGRVAEKGTVVTVLQDINLAAIFCDYLIFMKTGTIVTHGRTDAVLDSESIRTVFNVDSKVYPEPYTGAKQVVFKR